MNINPGDFSIIRSIGERFKDIEKFLKKNNFVLLNQKIN